MIRIDNMVKDTLTAFQGVVIATSEFKYEGRGCLVQPRQLGIDGAPARPIWIQEQRLEIVEA